MTLHRRSSLYGAGIIACSRLSDSRVGTKGNVKIRDARDPGKNRERAASSLSSPHADVRTRFLILALSLLSRILEKAAGIMEYHNNNNNLILETAHTTRVSMLFTIKNYKSIYVCVYKKIYIH